MTERTPRPLRIDTLEATHFRNLSRLSIEPGPAFNVVHGDNGAGKSSLLEAIYYLGALRSFRGAKADDLVMLGQDSARLQARISGGPARRSYRATIRRRKARELKLDEKRPRSIGVWHASVQMVLFHPGHLSLASGPADQRRVFLDRVLEQLDPTYGSTLTSYQKALRSRNRLLKSDEPDPRGIRAFDELLASAGAVIATTRARLVADIAPLTEKAFADVVGEEVPLRVEYKPRVPPSVQAIREALDASFEKDLARGFTADGPHGDDLALDIADRAPARHHASQGQHRAIVLALKVAELEVLSRRTDRIPILLLDDVSSELDRTRNRRFFALLGRLGGQVFLTTTHPEFILLEEGRTDFAVQNGEITREDE
jgi:DNA replication and repair protein RecF